MELKIPKIGLPWRRKTALERAGDEFNKIRADLGRRAEQINLPKVELRAPKTEDLAGAVDDTRHAVRQGVEQVADQVMVGTAVLAREAGKLGREAGNVGRQASRFGWRIGRRGRAATGENVRDATGTRRSRVVPGLALLGGVGAGVAAMFFLDPEQGRRRRALLRDQAIKWTRITRETVDGRLTDLRNRTAGLAHEATSLIKRNGGGDGQQPELAEIAVAESTPHAAPQLTETDLAADRAEREGNPASAHGEQVTTERVIPVEVVETEASTTLADEHPAAEREGIYGAFGEVAEETWGDDTGVHGAREGEHDLSQRS